MATIDTCGRSCPEPVCMVLTCLKKDQPDTVDVLVDNTVAQENVRRAAVNNGYAVSVVEEGEVARLRLQKQ